MSLLEREMQQHFGNVAQLKADISEEGNTRRKVYAKVIFVLDIFDQYHKY
jgi:hypothetical protein